MNDPSLASATFNVDHAYGTADHAIAYVEELKDAGVDEVMCMIQMGRSPRTSAWRPCAPGDGVIPHFRRSAQD